MVGHLKEHEMVDDSPVSGSPVSGSPVNRSPGNTSPAGGSPGGEGEAGYGIGAVARRLGVPAPTLRTWNLRYGLGPSRRSPGGHRRYDAADLRRLEEMKRLIGEGLPPAEAARQVLAPAATPPAPESPLTRPEDPTLPEPPASTGQSASTGQPSPTGQPDRLDRPDPAGRAAVRLTASALARAALVLDARAVSDLVETALAAHGVVWTWERLVLPVFETICRRQHETGSGIDVEHILSDRVQAALHRLARASGRAAVRPVLLACAEDEQHSLPVHALAAALGELDVETRVLGARTPNAALADAMRRLGPVAVFVWSQQDFTGDTTPLAALPRLRPPCQIVAGGPGWQGELPPGAVRVTTFHDAIAILTP